MRASIAWGVALGAGLAMLLATYTYVVFLGHSEQANRNHDEVESRFSALREKVDQAHARVVQLKRRQLPQGVASGARGIGPRLGNIEGQLEGVSRAIVSLSMNSGAELDSATVRSLQAGHYTRLAMSPGETIQTRAKAFQELGKLSESELYMAGELEDVWVDLVMSCQDAGALVNLVKTYRNSHGSERVGFLLQDLARYNSSSAVREHAVRALAARFSDLEGVRSIVVNASSSDPSSSVRRVADEYMRRRKWD